MQILIHLLCLEWLSALRALPSGPYIAQSLVHFFAVKAEHYLAIDELMRVDRYPVAEDALEVGEDFVVDSLVDDLIDRERKTWLLLVFHQEVPLRGTYLSIGSADQVSSLEDKVVIDWQGGIRERGVLEVTTGTEGRVTAEPHA